MDRTKKREFFISFAYSKWQNFFLNPNVYRWISGNTLELPVWYEKMAGFDLALGTAFVHKIFYNFWVRYHSPSAKMSQSITISKYVFYSSLVANQTPNNKSWVVVNPVSNMQLIAL